MPSRNQQKPSHGEGLFHVYSRGFDRRPIFGSAVDSREFLQCFRRYLCTDGTQRDRSRRAYRHLDNEGAVLAYCLMPNHFHLVIHQRRPFGMAHLMRPAITGYVMYYNRRHGRSGRLFESVYKASPIDDHRYAKAAIAYVHSNHPEDPGFELCSHDFYTGHERPDWIDTKAGLAVFGGPRAYERFLAGYRRTRPPALIRLRP